MHGLAKQVCRVCGWVRHLNGNGDWSAFYPHFHQSFGKKTVELVTCDACKLHPHPREGNDNAPGNPSPGA